MKNPIHSIVSSGILLWYFLACGTAGDHAKVQLRIVEKSASHIDLTWQVPSGVDSVIIQRRTNEAWMEVGRVSSEITAFASTGILANTEATHRLQLLRSDKNEVYSESIIDTTGPMPDARRCRIIDKTMPRQSEGSMIRTGDSLQLYYCSFTANSDKARSRIARKISFDDGDSWSEMELVFDQKERGEDEFPGIGKPGWHLLHPQVVRLINGNVCLTYAKMVPDTWYAHRVFRISGDDGRSWSDERKLTDDAFDYATGASDRMYQLSNGRIISLVHVRMPGDDKKTGVGTQVYALDSEYHDDPAGHWKNMNPDPLFVDINVGDGTEWGFWEGALVEHDPGKLLMYARTGAGWFYQARSDDFGTTWTGPQRTNIRAPETPAYLKMIPGTDKMLLIWNPFFDGEEWHMGDRWILASMISDNAGKTWRNYKEIEYHSTDYWYAYPFLLFDKGNAHLCYDMWTFDPQRRRDLAYLKLADNWFLQ